MRWAWLCIFLLAGCAGTAPSTGDSPAPTSCVDAMQETTLWLGPGHTLTNQTPSAGAVFSNGFDEAFLVDEMDEWTSAPAERSMRIVGNITLEFWARNHGTPAPVVVGGDPGDGYHWFNQIGTQRGFMPDFGREYAPVAPEPDSVDHYTEVIATPPGGLHVEKGDVLRVLLTSLVVDDTQGTGQEILFGGDTPSHISFSSHCMPDLAWRDIDHAEVDIAIRAHQGLITGAVPATDGVNTASVPFTLHEATQRLTIALEQTGDPNPLKDDMDITVLDAQGDAVTSIGSPYADDRGTFYAANLAAMMPPGEYTVRVDSYSGHAYEGTVSITQDQAMLPDAAM